MDPGHSHRDTLRSNPSTPPAKTSYPRRTSSLPTSGTAAVKPTQRAHGSGYHTATDIVAGLPQVRSTPPHTVPLPSNNFLTEETLSETNIATSSTPEATPIRLRPMASSPTLGRRSQATMRTANTDTSSRISPSKMYARQRAEDRERARTRPAAPITSRDLTLILISPDATESSDSLVAMPAMRILPCLQTRVPRQASYEEFTDSGAVLTSHVRADAFSKARSHATTSQHQQPSKTEIEPKASKSSLTKEIRTSGNAQRPQPRLRRMPGTVELREQRQAQSLGDMETSRQLRLRRVTGSRLLSSSSGEEAKAAYHMVKQTETTEAEELARS